MNKFNVHFDLENNDQDGAQRTITIPQTQWDFTKCQFKCEMWRAGGDWQYPAKYFKCQLVKGYAFGVNTYDKNAGMFVFIPGKKEGNYHLVKPKPGADHWIAPDSSDYKEGIDPEPDDKKCWQALNEYLKKLVEDEIVKTQTEDEGRAAQQIEGEKQIGKEEI